MFTQMLVQIEFASPKILAKDRLDDSLEAVVHSNRNLYYKHNVFVSLPFVKNDKVFVNLNIPTALSENFRVGNHLRGISSYLLREKDYKQYRIGTRLLFFTKV